MPAAIRTFVEACAHAGFDLAAPLGTDWCADDPSLHLPCFGRESAYALVIGNTRALWPVFTKALHGDSALLEAENPLDMFTESRIAAAAMQVGVAWVVRWAHRPAPQFVPIQRIAERAGFAWVSPANLCIHPRFGPWIGLRAVVIFDMDPPEGLPSPAKDPCGACLHRCLPVFRDCQKALESGALGAAAGGEGWRAWLALRDACPLGREHRFDEAQIRYHYTKDRSILV